MIATPMPPPAAGDLLARRLARLKNRATVYEVAAVNRDTGRKILVMYGPTSKTRLLRGLMRIPNGGSETRLAMLARATGTAVDGWWTDRAGIRSGSWEIKVTGRTQREAYIAGELAETIYDERTNETNKGDGQ